MIKDFEKCVDKVYISKKDMRKIDAWGMHNRAVTLKLNEKHFFPLNTFIMYLEDYNLLILLELNNFNPVDFHYTTDLMEGDFKRNYERGDGFDITVLPADGAMSIFRTKEKLKEAATILTNKIAKIMLYLEYEGKMRRKEKRISPNISRELRENYQYKERELFLLKDIIEYVTIHPNKSSIKYRCECCGVRGHFRHYETGQVIFIHPFKKGKKRDILEPKSNTYLTDGEKEDDNE